MEKPLICLAPFFSLWLFKAVIRFWFSSVDHRTKTLAIALAKYQDKKQEIVHANTGRNKRE